MATRFDTPVSILPAAGVLFACVCSKTFSSSLFIFYLSKENLDPLLMLGIVLNSSISYLA